MKLGKVIKVVQVEDVEDGESAAPIASVDLASRTEPAIERLTTKELVN